MSRHVVAALLGLAILAATGTASEAFWKRSQWEACNEAPTEAERVRLKCWLFEPVPHFPAGAVEGWGWYEEQGLGRRERLPAPGGPVVRRLG